MIRLRNQQNTKKKGKKIIKKKKVERKKHNNKQYDRKLATCHTPVRLYRRLILVEFLRVLGLEGDDNVDYADVCTDDQTYQTEQDQAEILYQQYLVRAELVRWPEHAHLDYGWESDPKGGQTESTEEGDEQAQSWYSDRQRKSSQCYQRSANVLPK